jgi:hypothetical protein
MQPEGKQTPEPIRTLARRIISGQVVEMQTLMGMLYFTQPNFLVIEPTNDPEIWTMTLFYDTYIVDLTVDIRGNIVTNVIFRFNFDVKIDAKLR